VVGHNQVSTVTNEEAACTYAVALQIIYLLKKYCWINSHTIADNASYLRVKNARRDEMQPKLAIRVDYSMTGIVSAGETNYYLRLLSQKINYLSLPFITPLPSHDSYDSHLVTFNSCLLP
jgi:hypothetical protein